MGQHLLSDHSTLRVGGPAPLWLSHTHDADWPDLARTAAQHHDLPITLGGGSNTLAAGHSTNRPVIHMATRGIRTRDLGNDRVEVTAAGHPLTELVAHTVTESLSGIEYLGGIPGTAGAAPPQNAVAYGQQIGDRLTAVTAPDWTTGRTTRIPAAECGLGAVRSSVFGCAERKGARLRPRNQERGCISRLSESRRGGGVASMASTTLSPRSKPWCVALRPSCDAR